MEPLDTVIEFAVEAVTEIADAAIAKKIEKKRAQKKNAADDENAKSKADNAGKEESMDSAAK